jgi:hypothetical protein
MKHPITLLFAILLLSCNQKNSDWIDRSKHEGLYKQDLSNEFEVYSSVENPEDIKNTVGILESAKKYYDGIFDENLNFGVLFIDNENWNKYAFSPPPGMPQAYYEGNIVLGLGKSVIARNAENGIKQAPPPVQEVLKQHYGENIDLDFFYRDALSLHELGHLYQFYRMGKGFQRRWLNELFGNLCQVGAASSFDSPIVLDQMDVLQTTMVRRNQWGELKFKTLNQFEADYFQIMQQGQNYGWYQTQFYFKAKELHSNFGDDFLKLFRDFLIETNPDNIGELSNEELNELLLDSFGIQAVDIMKWEYES